MRFSRLPSSVVPTRYEIRIEPDLPSGTFAGAETVEVIVKEPVAEIVLNAAELQIQQISIQDRSGRVLAGTVTLDEPNELASLRFPETLRSGFWQL